MIVYYLSNCSREEVDIIKLIDDFLKLSDVEQKNLLRDLLITKKEIVNTYLKINIYNKWLKKDILKPVFKGIFLYKSLEKALNKKIVEGVKSSNQCVEIHRMINNLSEEELIKFIREITVDRTTAISILGIKNTTFDTYINNRTIEAIKRGVFLRSNIEAQKERKIASKKYLYTDSIYFTEERCISALKEAALYFEGSFTSNQYDEWAKNQPLKPAAITIIKKFKRWNTALRKAGLSLINKRITTRSFSHEEKTEICIKALQKAFEDIGSSLTVEKYREWRKSNLEYPSSVAIINNMQGWNNALNQANIPINKRNNN